MKKRNLLKTVVAVGLSMSMLAGCAGGGASSTNGNTTAAGGTEKSEEQGEGSGDVVKIAALFPLSGVGADNGKQNVNGCQLAVEHINAAGGIASLGGAKLELVTGDLMSDTNQCKTVAERLMQDTSIVAATGASASSYVLPMLPVFEKVKTPFVTAQVAPAITNQGYQYVFETTAMAPENGKVQVNFIKFLNETHNMGLEKIGIIYENTEYGQSNAKSAVELAGNAGLEIVFNESFPAGIADASALIANLKQSGAQVVIPSCYTQDAKTIFNTMKSMNYSPVIVGGGSGFLYPAFANELQDAVNGITSSASGSWDTKNVQDNEDFKKIPELYMEKYNEFMTEQALASYNIIWLISQALEKSGSTDKDVLRDTIRGMNIDTMVVGGPLAFDETGYNTNAYAIINQWQKQEDGTYLPRTIFPESAATADYQKPE
ncbi:MAG: ABC transporter substrate-binding protein [Lacrimispora sp.]|uniref:ABC transporter substrate-binding protein n=1 Tax=Lacrimispora sp. TaxID=2719234 RepID=UPI0039E62CBB